MYHGMMEYMEEGVILYNPSTNQVTQFYDGPNVTIKIHEAKDMTFAPLNLGNYGNLMFVLNENKPWPTYDNQRIVIIHPDQSAEVFFDLSQLGNYDFVRYMDFSPDGIYLYVATNNTINRINSNGNFELVQSGSLKIIDIEFDLAGNLFLYDNEAKKLTSININSLVQISNNTKPQLPHSISLFQNYPNPFNPTTNIRYEIPTASYIEMNVYNSLGEKIRTLVNKQQPAGKYEIIWNGKDDWRNPVESGLYIYQLNAGQFHQSRKMILMK